ncbi:flippase-like domain-containing protein [candidate division WOR-3 bacterium]|nr:flippase-like domain-containing protein [candidate division WOR-3 bacterium]MCK4575422.1 flippase-like domain-containing protein [candidate division WOR-3 bacterium]
MKYKQSLLFVLRFVIGFGLLIILFWKVGAIEILGKLRQIEPLFIFLSILLFLSAVAVISLRWRILLSAHSISIPFHKTVSYYLVGFFFNNFLPTIVGLDLIRAVYVSNIYGRKAECFASVISEKVIGLLAILLLGVFFLPIFILRDRFILFIFFGLFILLILFIAGIFFFPKRKKLKGFTWLFRMRILLKLREKIKSLYDALYYYKDKKAALIQTLLLSLLYQVILVTIFFFIGRALLVTIPYYYFLAFIPVINIGSMIPLTPNGIGIRESLCVYLFSLAGVGSSQSILISMIYFGIALFVSLLGAVIFIFGIRKERK